MQDTAAILNQEQLRDITMDDDALMREILGALIDDTTRQMHLLDAAIREQDARPVRAPGALFEGCVCQCRSQFRSAYPEAY